MENIIDIMILIVLSLLIWGFAWTKEKISRKEGIVTVSYTHLDAGRRIKNVLNFKKPHTWVAAIATVLVALVAVSCLTNHRYGERRCRTRPAHLFAVQVGFLPER